MREGERSPPTRGVGVLGRCFAMLRAHPVLCLALLTPGIPEYLSGSSSPAVLLVNPGLFGIFLALNLGMYTAGVLLIREARIRWGLAWASVLLLGLAYGIAEEGLALTTLFDPHNANVPAATAGSWAGVNWGWSAGILPFHALFSVALPIFLLDRARPDLRGRSIVVGRALAATAAIYGATIAGLAVVFATRICWMGAPVLAGSLLAILGLVGLSRALRPDVGRPRAPRARLGPAGFFALGLSLFPVALVGPGILGPFHPPIAVLVALTVGIWAGFFVAFVIAQGARGGELGAVAFSVGLLLPIMALGEIVAVARYSVGMPAVVAADAIALAFLWRTYRSTRAERSDAPGAPPPGAWPASGSAGPG